LRASIRRGEVPVRDGELMGDAREGGNEKPSNPMCKR
jgi:hypothetical protein